jgi:hypothetical protein
MFTQFRKSLFHTMLAGMSLLATAVPTGVAHASATPVPPPPMAVLLDDPAIDAFANAHLWLGSKVGGVQGTLGRDFQDFSGGTVYDYEGQVHEVHGQILVEYRALGGPGGWLGFPISDQTLKCNAIEYFNNFQYGAIYWTAADGAQALHNVFILASWYGPCPGLQYQGLSPVRP